MYHNRLKLLSILFFISSLTILSRMFFIQSFEASSLRNKMQAISTTKRTVVGERGNIYDRQGKILAETIKKYIFWVNTEQAFDRDRIINLFSTEFKEPVEKYRKLLSQKKSYVRITGRLLKEECDHILSQIKDIKGLHCDISIDRYYPYNNLFSQVVGYVDMDHKGQLGIEQKFDPILSGKTSQLTYDRAANGRISKSFKNQQQNIENGLDIYLTIDIDIQTVLVDALKRGMERSYAISANGIIINPLNGDILAMASIPDFNPNSYANYTNDAKAFTNKVISDAYEPGSTFKLISMAAILESNIYSDDDIIYCEQGEHHISPNKIIHDHEPHGELSISEIFIHSSNIGIVKAVSKLGPEHIYDYARNFGFGIQTGIPLPGESSGILRSYNDWSHYSAFSISMGQEISVNTLQLALAYCAVANGGYLLNPRIIKNISLEKYMDKNSRIKPIRKVISKKTASILLSMMEGVVNEGTANKASIPGFRIGGKTGTAEKFIDGEYSKKHFISSFAAIFPLERPKYVCIISVDSPLYGYHWGNETAVPIVKEIFQRLIMNNNMDSRGNKIALKPANKLLESYREVLAKEQGTQKIISNKVPKVFGKTLKQSLQEARLSDVEIYPFGMSDKVAWQSISPGITINNNIPCQIKLESL